VNSKKSLEDADAHCFQPRCLCGWTGEMAGVVAIKHWVVSWKGNAPIVTGVTGTCDGEPLEKRLDDGWCRP